MTRTSRSPRRLRPASRFAAGAAILALALTACGSPAKEPEPSAETTSEKPSPVEISEVPGESPTPEETTPEETATASATPSETPSGGPTASEPIEEEDMGEVANVDPFSRYMTVSLVDKRQKLSAEEIVGEIGGWLQVDVDLRCKSGIAVGEVTTCEGTIANPDSAMAVTKGPLDAGLVPGVEGTALLVVRQRGPEAPPLPEVLKSGNLYTGAYLVDQERSTDNIEDALDESFGLALATDGPSGADAISSCQLEGDALVVCLTKGKKPQNVAGDWVGPARRGFLKNSFLYLFEKRMS